jgi:hypothetical protein
LEQSLAPPHFEPQQLQSASHSVEPMSTPTIHAVPSETPVSRSETPLSYASTVKPEANQDVSRSEMPLSHANPSLCIVKPPNVGLDAPGTPDNVCASNSSERPAQTQDRNAYLIQPEIRTRLKAQIVERLGAADKEKDKSGTVPELMQWLETESPQILEQVAMKRVQTIEQNTAATASSLPSNYSSANLVNGAVNSVMHGDTGNQTPGLCSAESRGQDLSPSEIEALEKVLANKWTTFVSLKSRLIVLEQDPCRQGGVKFDELKVIEDRLNMQWKCLHERKKKQLSKMPQIAVPLSRARPVQSEAAMSTGKQQTPSGMKWSTMPTSGPKQSETATLQTSQNGQQNVRNVFSNLPAPTVDQLQQRLSMTLPPSFPHQTPPSRVTVQQRTAPLPFQQHPQGPSTQGQNRHPSRGTVQQRTSPLLPFQQHPQGPSSQGQNRPPSRGTAQQRTPPLPNPLPFPQGRQNPNCNGVQILDGVLPPDRIPYPLSDQLSQQELPPHFAWERWESFQNQTTRVEGQPQQHVGNSALRDQLLRQPHHYTFPGPNSNVQTPPQTPSTVQHYQNVFNVQKY